MRIYEYQGSTGYEMLHCADSEGTFTLVELDGLPRAKTWKPIRVRRVRPSKREGCRASDSPICTAVSLIFRRSAVDALRDILDAHGELLPLEDEEGVELYAYNAKRIDGLDHQLSKGSRDEDGRVVVPNTHVFIPSIVKDVDIFRQGKERSEAIYLSERFLQRWKKAKLKGLDFILAWDSDLPPDQQPNVWLSKPVKMSTIRG